MRRARLEAAERARTEAAAGGWAARPALVRLAAAALLLVTSACTRWELAQTGEAWSLYVRPGDGALAPGFAALLDPAVAAVEQSLGPFEQPVSVHAWNGGVDLESGTRGRVVQGEDAGRIEALPSIGSARVRAFHMRGDGLSRGGVYLGEAAPSSAVHELVHARLDELRADPPLWFEEGLAQLLADGVLAEDRWVRDGLCAWPLSVLRERTLGDDELERLLGLTASEPHTVEENLLVHFVGWAVVFDLCREDPDGAWSDWLATFDGEAREAGAVAAARARLAGVLAADRVLLWVRAGLDSEDPMQRFATARGLWRIADPATLGLLGARLRAEPVRDVRAALAINLLAAAGEGRYGGRGRWRGVRLPLEVLSELPFDDPDERAAGERLMRGYERGGRGSDVQAAFEGLARFWQE